MWSWSVLPEKQGQFDSLFRGQEKVVEQWVTFFQVEVLTTFERKDRLVSVLTRKGDAIPSSRWA